MANHKLSLEIPDTRQSCSIKIEDTSIYNTNINVTCPILLVLVPGFTAPQVVDNVVPGFSLILTACDLKVQSINCGTVFNDLPDGIYVVRWSISPNDVVFVEYNFLRTTKALNKIAKIYCELDMGACDPSETIHKKLRELRDIQDILLAAKAKVETCREATQGLVLYKYAMQKLDKLKCRTCH